VTVGSTNLDPPSFALSEELNLIVYDRTVARRMDDIFTTDLSYATVVDYETWRRRGMRSRLFELLAFPMRDLF
jgi:cardiolipin synthase